MQVKRIDYYQRTDQALSQLLSPASVEAHGGEVTTYLHGDGLLTLRMARLPEGQGLPGADANQIWFWLRPRQVRLRPVASTLWRWRLASVLYHKRGHLHVSLSENASACL